MNKHSENFSFVLFVVFNYRGENHSLQAKKKKENNSFGAHFFKSKTLMFGREMNDCRTKYRNIKFPGFFFKLKLLFSYLINMARLLVFLEFWFSLKFSVSSLNVFLNYSQILRVQYCDIIHSEAVRRCSVP